MEDKAQELYAFIQERYLWQFYSRTWDREENINEILKKFAAIIKGEKVKIADTFKDKAFYAEAKTVAVETKRKFPWLEQLEKSRVDKIVAEVKEKLIDVTITRSQNGELNVQNY